MGTKPTPTCKQFLEPDNFDVCPGRVVSVARINEEALIRLDVLASQVEALFRSS